MQGAVLPGTGSMAAIMGIDGARLEALCRQAAAGEVVAPAEFQRPRTDRRRRPCGRGRAGRRARRSRQGACNPPEGQRPLSLLAHGAPQRIAVQERARPTSSSTVHVFRLWRTSTRNPMRPRAASKSSSCGKSTAQCVGRQASGTCWPPGWLAHPRDRPGTGPGAGLEPNRQGGRGSECRRPLVIGQSVRVSGGRSSWELNGGRVASIRRGHVPSRGQDRARHGRLPWYRQGLSCLALAEARRDRGRELRERRRGGPRGRGKHHGEGWKGRHCRLRRRRLESGVDTAVEELLKRHGKVDILIANAGLSIDALLLRMKDDDFDKLFATNVRGAVACARHQPLDRCAASGAA